MTRGDEDRALRARHPRGDGCGRPEECGRFETEFRQALARADTDFDLSLPSNVCSTGGGASLTSGPTPLSDTEREQVTRARAGDETGWIVHHEDGTRTRL